MTRQSSPVNFLNNVCYSNVFLVGLLPCAQVLVGAVRHPPATSKRDYFVMSNTKLSGDGPNDAHGTTPVWFTPGFDQSHTPLGKMLCKRVNSADVKFT